jgi:MFS family permease
VLKYLTRTVIALSFVSLFADIASEMLYPVMPFYLKSIGFTALAIGLLEGFAQFVVGFSSGYFGKLSDKIGKRMPFVTAGYFLAAIGKPMMTLSVYPPWIFFSRFIDRLGKGVRTGARDAVLSMEAQDSDKGKVFGFHRGMDSLGAAIGPALALVYLIYHPGNYRNLFLIAFAPGLISAAITFLVREKKVIVAKAKSSSANFFSFLGYWKTASPAYKQITAGLLCFALFNSSDAFLFLAAKSGGMKDNYIIGAYIFYNVVFAAMSFPAGALADKFGMKKAFITGLILFAAVYAGMSAVHENFWLFLWFFIYGIYAAFTDGVSSAWISKNCSKEERGTALGFYKSMSSICLLMASTITGLIWMRFSPHIALLYSTTGAVAVAFYFLLTAKEKS